MDFTNLQIDKLLQYISAALALIVTALGFRGHVFDGLARKRRHLEEEYEAAKRFFADDSPGRPALLVERSFALVSGRHDLTAQEVRLILALPDPTRSIGRIASVRACVRYVPDRIKPAFHPGLAKQRNRRLAKVIAYLAYLAFALTAVATFTAGALAIRKAHIADACALLPMTIACIVAAILCIREGRKVAWAEQLIEQVSE